MLNLKYFFNPEGEQIKVKKDFFNIDNKNFVFHYGLEIFRTLVTARKGIFAVCGYNEHYENFGDLYLEMAIMNCWTIKTQRNVKMKTSKRLLKKDIYFLLRTY